MCGVWRGYDVAGVEGGEFALRLVSRQRVAPLYWRSDTHTYTTPSPWWCHLTLQQHGYGKSANTLTVASLEGGGGQGQGKRILVNYVNQPRKKLISKPNV